MDVSQLIHQKLSELRLEQRFKNGRRPNALYYYRELQNLRDPLHFPKK